MTSARQKASELHYVQQAAALLGKQWTLSANRENPDFIVVEDGKKFGLEVIQIFSGSEDRKGSSKRRSESDTQRAIDGIRREFEAKHGVNLNVRLLGPICAATLAVVVPALEDLNLSDREIGYQTRLSRDVGDDTLVVYVTRSLRSQWYSVHDRTGWVDQNPAALIENKIEQKSSKVESYKANTGLDDIRLLIVADRTLNSGKLMLEGAPRLNLFGFQEVYFLSYPVSATVLR